MEIGVGVGVVVEDVGSARAATPPTDRAVNAMVLAEATATAVDRAIRTRRIPGVRFLTVPPDSLRTGAISAASRPSDRTSRVVDYSTLGSHPLEARSIRSSSWIGADLQQSVRRIRGRRATGTWIVDVADRTLRGVMLPWVCRGAHTPAAATMRGGGQGDRTALRPTESNRSALYTTDFTT